MFCVFASDGLHSQTIRVRSLCAAIRALELVVMNGNACECVIYDSGDREIFCWCG